MKKFFYFLIFVILSFSVSAETLYVQNHNLTLSSNIGGQYQAGMLIKTSFPETETCILKNVTVAGGVTAQKVYIYNFTDDSLILNRTLAGGIAPFDYTLINDTEYYVFGGVTYTDKYTAHSGAITDSKIIWESGAYNSGGFGVDANNYYSIQSMDIVCSVSGAIYFNIVSSLINNTEVTDRVSENIEYNGTLSGSYTTNLFNCSLIVNGVTNITQENVNLSENQNFIYDYGFLSDLITFQIYCENFETNDYLPVYTYDVDTSSYYTYYLGLEIINAQNKQVVNMIESAFIILLIFGTILLIYKTDTFINKLLTLIVNFVCFLFFNSVATPIFYLSYYALLLCIVTIFRFFSHEEEKM